jgi:hypothetical protein
MPRKSAASHLVVAASTATPVRVAPASGRKLTRRERAIFALAYRDNEHLRECDSPLVTAYSVAAARLETMPTKNVSDMEKLARCTLALARSLRLTLQSRVDPKTLSRAIKNKYVWESNAAEGGDNDDDDAA